jgi:hypothetical protein
VENHAHTCLISKIHENLVMLISSSDIFSFLGSTRTTNKIKVRWPHVVGLTASEAQGKIKRDCPELYCEVISINQLLTMCYCSHHVRIMVDRYGKVVKAP